MATSVETVARPPAAGAPPVAVAVAVPARRLAGPQAVAPTLLVAVADDGWPRLASEGPASLLPLHLQGGASASHDHDDEQGSEEEEEESGLGGGAAPAHRGAPAATLAWVKTAGASAAGGGRPPPTKAEATEPLVRLLAAFETQLASVGPAALAREYVSALASAPHRAALPPRVLGLVRLAGQAAELHLRRKLGRRAKKIQSLLSILPIKALVGVLASKDADPAPTARSVLSLLLARPLGGHSVLQRLTATSMALKARERRARRLAAQLPPPLRRALTAACRELSAGSGGVAASGGDHDGPGADGAAGRGSPHGWPVDLPTSAESAVALLLHYARELGDGEAVAAATALRGPSGAAAAGCACAALAAAREVQSGRAFVTLLGEKAFESTLSSLLPLCAVPLLRLGLSGDIPRLVARALPAVEALLRVVTSPALPPSQRDAVFTLAVDDVVGAVYAYAHRVAVASEAGAAARERSSGGQPADGRSACGRASGSFADGPRGGGELLKLVAWATESWERLRVPVELGLDPSGAGGEVEAALARLALAVRADHKARGRLAPELEAGLLASFEAQVADALGGTVERAG